MREWLMAQNAGWIFMIFPLIFGFAILGALNDQRKWNAKTRDLYGMTTEEYEQHNRERFRQ